MLYHVLGVILAWLHRGPVCYIPLTMEMPKSLINKKYSLILRYVDIIRIRGLVDVMLRENYQTLIIYAEFVSENSI